MPRTTSHLVFQKKLKEKLAAVENKATEVSNKVTVLIAVETKLNDVEVVVNNNTSDNTLRIVLTSGCLITLGVF